MSQLDDIASDLINRSSVDNRRIVLAISGFGGSGKSTLANQLRERLIDAEVVSIDAFIRRGIKERSADWEGFDRERFRRQVLEPTIHGEPILYQVYDWEREEAITWCTVPGSRYLIVEGCSIFHPDLLEYYDFTIWIDCPLERAIQQGSRRDRESGADHEALWHTVWGPNERDFFARYQPNAIAQVRYTG